MALGCCIPSAESDSCCVCSDGACMNILSRIFARTPSLRTRVVVATAIGAAIPVLIVGTVVWVGITNDRKERLDRRLDEAAGFAIPFVPRGLDEIPRSPNDQDALITVRRGNVIKSNSDITLPKLQDDYADTYVRGVRYRVRTVEIPGPEPTSVAVGATYDATVAETNNLHRRVLLICTFAIGAAAVFAWLLAAFAVRPFKQLAEQTRSIDAGDEAPRVEVHGASEAIEIAEAMRGMLQRIWNEQNRTKEALASARDFAAVSSHELRTPLTAMRTNLEVLSTLDLPDDQRKEVLNDVIRTQSRIEATLSALERLAQGELSTSDDHVPVDITDLLDRAAHDAARIYPDLDVSLVPSPTCIIVGLPAGLRLAVDNAIANAVKHGGATLVQLSAVSSRAGVEIAIDDNGSGVPEGERQVVFERFSRGSTASHSGSGLGLALVAQQAQLHGGTASLENSPLGGARLVLRLPGPVSPAALTSCPPCALAPRREKRPRCRLLVLEPNLGDSRVVRRIFGSVVEPGVRAALHQPPLRSAAIGTSARRARAVRRVRNHRNTRRRLAGDRDRLRRGLPGSRDLLRSELRCHLGLRRRRLLSLGARLDGGFSRRWRLGLSA